MESANRTEAKKKQTKIDFNEMQTRCKLSVNSCTYSAEIIGSEVSSSFTDLLDFNFGVVPPPAGCEERRLRTLIPDLN